MTATTLLDNFIEVKLGKTDDFLKIKETLTRIGVASKKDKKLYQSCHILHKQGKYYIVHFKELFLLDGKQAIFEDGDIARRNTIANLLEEWGLLELVSPQKSNDPVIVISQLKILPHKEKAQWELIAKYNIGKKKKETISLIEADEPGAIYVSGPDGTKKLNTQIF